MINSDNSYYETLSTSLDALRTLCIGLKSENIDLRKKVNNLEQQLESGISHNQESASNRSEVDTITMRNQISSYIKRIDQILESE